MTTMNRCFAAMLAAVFVLAPLASSPARANDEKAAALLAKHRAYVGWQLGDGTFTSFRIAGTIVDGKGKTTDTLQDLWLGILFKEADVDLRRGGVTDYNGFTGNVFWHSNDSGFTVPVYGDFAKYQASLTVLFSEGTPGLPGTFKKDTTIDGKPVSVVRVTMQNADAIDLYIDPSTGAYVQATIDPGGAYESTLHVLGYTDAAPGKKLVSSYRIGDSKNVTTFTKIEPNVEITGADLHPPAPTASWTFGSTSPAPIVVTHDRMLVDATVNGVKGRFILDTGADGIYLNDEFADRIHAPAEGSSTAYGVYDAHPIRMRKVDTLAIGDSTLHNFIAASQDFKHGDYRGLDAENYDGLMGFDLFAGAIVKLDVYDSKITVLDPATDLSNVAGVRAIVDVSSGQPTIGMKLNKTIDVMATLDTGNPDIVLFGPDLKKKYGLKILDCGNFESLALGPIVYQDVGACDAGFAGNYILLGFDFLKHLDIIFDYPHGKMIFTPNKNT